jgi:proline racemase
MCGHGLIGVVRTLEDVGVIGPGNVRIDTPAGTVSAELHESGHVTIRNVPAYCEAAAVAVDVPGIGRVAGSVAYGGNWFFIANVPGQPITLRRVGVLAELTENIRSALERAGITGRDGADIDHIELYEPLPAGVRGARTFVLCPGGEWDRSPCGTGTSAKLAVLHATGLLAPGDVWCQQSVTGGEFTAWLEEYEGQLVPWVRGRAFITAHSTLHFDGADPFIAGFGAAGDP